MVHNRLESMLNIFISYRRDDAGYVPGMLCERLRKVFGPSSVFIDLDTIPYGIDFRDHIIKAVSQCDVLLAIIGDTWLAARDDAGKRRLDDPGDFVRIEIEAAIARNIPIVPILIRNAAIPSPNDLPDTLQPLAFRNAAELRAGRDTNHHIDLLIRDLRSHLRPGPDRTEGATSGKKLERPSTAVESDSATLRFVRDTGWVGMAVAFKVKIDGNIVGKLATGETLDVAVSPGEHHIEITGAGTFYGKRKIITITADQVLSWKVGYKLTGGVKLSEW